MKEKEGKKKKINKKVNEWSEEMHNMRTNKINLIYIKWIFEKKICSKALEKRHKAVPDLFPETGGLTKASYLFQTD